MIIKLQEPRDSSKYILFEVTKNHHASECSRDRDPGISSSYFILYSQSTDIDT